MEGRRSVADAEKACVVLPTAPSSSPSTMATITHDSRRTPSMVNRSQKQYGVNGELDSGRMEKSCWPRPLTEMVLVYLVHTWITTVRSISPLIFSILLILPVLLCLQEKTTTKAMVAIITYANESTLLYTLAAALFHSLSF